jgi:cytochrome d ubiquinol oxidase subunit II
MVLAALPLVFVLGGLVLYVVLAGADFGAGFWQLFAGRGPHADRIREHAHNSMAPVWEANHVWLIFVLTVFWTAYPTALGSIASTLAVPLFIAGIGIVLRGAAYALRSGTSSARELRTIDTIFSISSILTPFALGTAVGGLASRRVPVGNAAGHVFSSWLNPTSILIGGVAVAACAYLAAVYLAADAARLGDAELRDEFRVRALGAGVVAGALALVGLVVLRSGAHHLFRELVGGEALPALIVSVLAGIGTLMLVSRGRLEAARYSAALAVGAVVVGWAIGQWPTILPGLTVRQAAASHDALVALIVAVLAGGAILFPSLALLFRLTLKGRLQDTQGEAQELTSGGSGTSWIPQPGLLTRVAIACLIAGFGLLTVADSSWAHAFGVVSLFGFIVSGFLAIVPRALAGEEPAATQQPDA